MTLPSFTTTCVNGHTAEVTPATSYVLDDRLIFVFGSAADFCQVCDDHVLDLTPVDPAVGS